MDMQDVQYLSIPDGEVRTIHDGNGNLLWGKLAYDTRYNGDTLQNGTPSPDAPVSVQVVTGTQTITVSDGVNSYNYALNLGFIELCKISTYQDYIYKSGSDWYIKKNIAKHILTKNDSWTKSGSVFYATKIIDYATSDNTPYCTILSGNNNVTGVTQAQAMNDITCAFINTSATPRFYIKNTSWSDYNALRDYLDNNVVYLYYALATPTDTQITDSTLISQLDAIHQFLTHYGYNATVSGNLPMIIDKTNL